MRRGRLFETLRLGKPPSIWAGVLCVLARENAVSFRQVNFFESIARTVTPAPSIVTLEQGVFNAEIVIAVTAATSTPSTVFTVEAQDGAGAWYPLLVSAAIVGVGTTRLLIGSGIVAAANVAAQVVLPEYIRVSPVHGNANSQTYTVSIRAR